jgi:hypothetical protein
MARHEVRTKVNGIATENELDALFDDMASVDASTL